MSRTRRFAIALTLLGGIAAVSASAADKPASTPSPERAAAGYLGIGVEPLHPAFGAHLLESLAPEQGVLIAFVAEGSPADRAGLKPHDILATYDDQKLFSAEQLVKLVRADKPGREVQLNIVRGGKAQTLKVTLGEEPADVAAREHAGRDLWERRFSWFLPREEFKPRPRGKRNVHQNTFDSLTLKKLDGDRYRAEIEYLDQDGKKQRHEFEGTREEIAEQIRAEKDLPEEEREQLLSGLQSPPPAPFERVPWFLWPDPFRNF